MRAARPPLLLFALLAMACGACGRAPGALGRAAPLRQSAPLPEEATLLGELRQLTFGGNQAKPRWSQDGARLSFQTRGRADGCEQAHSVGVAEGAVTAVPLAPGAGGGTSGMPFLPSGEIVYAARADATGCRVGSERDDEPWALDATSDLFKAGPEGTRSARLTSEAGYDAEPAVCARDGTILFTSTRDGDVELYRMDAAGRGVRRLTRARGYDGGASFNSDCTKIAWRASRPQPGAELDEYEALLARGQVRLTGVELWVANADGSEPMQLTYFDAAISGPTFHPAEDLIFFSSTHGDPSQREVDIWAIQASGAGLVRVTHAPGFDGFPQISPDGRWLAFSSSRGAPLGRADTNLFVARWKGLGAGTRLPAPADRIAQDVRFLAAPERTGRGVGTAGLTEAGAFLERRLAALGLEPDGDEGGFRQRFPIVTSVEVAPGTRLELGGRRIASDEFVPLGFSASGVARGEIVFAGHGLVDRGLGLDDYAGRDVRGKIVLVRRFAPGGERFADATVRRRLGDLRRKAWLARERGAAALLVVDAPTPPASAPPGWTPPAESPLPAPQHEGPGDAGIPVALVKRAVVAALLPRLEARRPVQASLTIELTSRRSEAFNVVGRIRAGRRDGGSLVLGAHYDHLGYGGRHSLAPERREPHHGADDNASGTAILLELSRAIAARRAELRRDVVIVFFSGEELGLLGSTHFVRARPGAIGDLVAMINFDMVGRLRGNRVDVLGSDTATEWRTLVQAACADARLLCRAAGDGHGPSDQASFFAAGVPVLHFFTGPHADYHKPTDLPEKINAAGAAAIARAADNIVRLLEVGPRLTFQRGHATAGRIGLSQPLGASLGTIPDYAGPPPGHHGVLLAGVREGGAAHSAGMRRGDLLVKLGTHAIHSVDDLKYVLDAAKPGQTVAAVVKRDGRELRVAVTYKEAGRAP